MAGVGAQQPPVPPVPAEGAIRIFRPAMAPERVAVESRITKGAPYSADAVTESVQLLADGNRIVHRSTTRVFRDNDGRTRREQLDDTGSHVRTINISDPVAEATYVLDPATRTAYHNGVIIATANGIVSASVNPGGNGTIITRRNAQGGVSVSATDGEERKMVQTMTGRGGGVGVGDYLYTTGQADVLKMVPAEPLSPTAREDLGQQMIDNVLATGTRMTTEIPAGTIGNEQAIRIVSEQWFSPELQLLVLTRHSDPRVGETTYRLTGIVRTEPAHSLFEVPADYTLHESLIKRQDR
jgi:hypothetical protein